MFVNPEDFWRMLHEVERRIAWDKGGEHGSFNYTDLLVLSENGIIMKTIKALMLEMGKVIHVLISYSSDDQCKDSKWGSSKRKREFALS